MIIYLYSQFYPFEYLMLTGSEQKSFFFPFCYRKSNAVVEARQVAMRIFEDYTQSWHWILL